MKDPAVARRWLGAVVRQASVVVALLLALGGAAYAGPRLVLLDGTEAAALHQALVVSLQPWAFEVVDWPSDPAGFDAAAVASRANARYGEWHDAGAGELVVLDAELAVTERRPLEALPAEEDEATAVALAVKMMLRLPAAPAAVAAAAPEPMRWRLVPVLRVGARFGIDGDAASAARAQVGLEVAPPALRGLRVGALLSLGAATALDRAGFQGDWSEWSALVSTSKQLGLGGWALQAQLAAGLSRSSLDGVQARVARNETMTHGAGALALGGGRRLGAFTLGGVAVLEVRGASRFARDNGQPLWTEPGFLVSALAAVELEL